VWTSCTGGWCWGSWRCWVGCCGACGNGAGSRAKVGYACGESSASGTGIPQLELCRQLLGAVSKTTCTRLGGHLDTIVRRVYLLAALLGAGALLGCSRPPDSSPSPPVSSEPVAKPASPDPVGIPVSKGQVKANGITIAYESFGPEDRETVLLIMGASAQLTLWPVELCEELVNRGYRVIRYDNRDVGLSTHFDSAGPPDFAAVVAAAKAGKPSPLPYTLDDMARDAVGLLDALGIKKAHIAGPSMGGMIGQIIAADHPDRTLSLTPIMAGSGKPVVPDYAKPEVLAKFPPPAPVGDKQAYIEQRIKVFQLIGSPRAPIDEKILREWITRDVERSYYPAGEA